LNEKIGEMQQEKMLLAKRGDLFNLVRQVNGFRTPWACTTNLLRKMI